MRLRDAVPDDLPRVMELQRRVVSELAHAEMFYADSLDAYAAMMAEGGVISLAESANMLIGCSILRLPPADSPDNLGFDLGFDASGRGCVAHLDAAFLLPDFRGRGLAFSLGRRNMRRAALAGRHIVCATAWPGNAASIRNLKALGFCPHSKVTKYGGLQRLLLWCDMSGQPELFLHCHKEHI